MTVATITSKGQVTIPKTVRDSLGIKAGDRVDFVITVDGTVLVKPCTTDLEAVQGSLKTNKSLSIDDMKRAIAAFHAQRRAP